MPRAKTIEKEIERKRKISEACKKQGVGLWMKGRELSKETRLKMSKRMEGNTCSLGIKASEETKRKMSESAKKAGNGKWMSEKTGENANNWKGGKPKCLDCKKELSLYKYIRCFDCSIRFSKGENARNWRGGISKDLAQYRRNRRNLELNIEGSHTLEEWEDLKKKFNHICLCCKQQEPFIKLTEDHIVPVARRGNDYIENIQPLCQSCNSRKWAKTINFIEQHV